MKERLDVILVSGGLAESREKAKAVIMAGSVFVDGQKEDKAGAMFDREKVKIEVKSSAQRYVSRGGYKLEKAINCFGVSTEGKVCMDIGASTGGFTDCMLQNGAVKVYSVDVGHGQLDWKLRNDARVVCMEKTNFRYMVREDIAEEPDFASVDVSFISLTKILFPLRRILKDGGSVVCLIKPQFEAGREKVGKKGVVKEPAVHREVIRKVLDFADSLGYTAEALDYSPIKGPEGNIEYLLLLTLHRESKPLSEAFSEQDAERELARITEEGAGISGQDMWRRMVEETVKKAHEELDAK
ncbi:MAG: TlyA family RNA methyltransferase [Lachnospiraceae bacterium]|nr:TlyA family RNA methyltransferase [Lachnospiraceae bacterium]